MTLQLKAKLYAQQGKTPDQILQLIIQEGDAKIKSMDELLAKFVEESPIELVRKLILDRIL